jgi:hypothetical protein
VKLVSAVDKVDDEVESSARENEEDEGVDERRAKFRGSTDNGLCRATRKRGWCACRERAPMRESEDAVMERKWVKT